MNGLKNFYSFFTPYTRLILKEYETFRCTEYDMNIERIQFIPRT